MSEYRRYRRLPARPSTAGLTAKLTLLAVIATILIGGLIAVQMAAGHDPALGPKAAARAKRATTRSPANASTPSGSGSGNDPYSEGYGDDGYAYGYGSGGYPNGSSGYSSGSSGYSYSPPPVTSGTS